MLNSIHTVVPEFKQYVHNIRQNNSLPVKALHENWKKYDKHQKNNKITHKCNIAIFLRTNCTYITLGALISRFSNLNDNIKTFVF